MEIHPLHEVTKGFWLKGSEARVTNLPAEKRAGVGGGGQKHSPSGLLHQFCLSHSRLAIDYTLQGLPAEPLSSPANSPSVRMTGQAWLWGVYLDGTLA